MRQHNTSLKLAFVVAIFLTAPTQPVLAAPVEELRCLDDQLDENQRAAIGSHFAEQTDDPTKERELANGSDTAAKDFAATIGGCAHRFNWDQVERQAAEQYLIRLGKLSQIAAANGEQWSQAMERYARFGKRLLPTTGEVTDHQRAMIVAGAKANGVPVEDTDENDAAIILYLEEAVKVDNARSTFQSA